MGPNGTDTSEEPMTMDAIRERLRGDCYRMLAVCFYPPGDKSLLEEDLLGNLSAALRPTCPEALGSAEEMERSMPQAGNEELAVDHARLFVGPFGLKAAPYGSLYLDGDGKVMGDSTMRVIQIYEQEGLELDGEFGELPDHVAAELEFLYYLIYRAVGEFEEGGIEGSAHSLAVQLNFLSEFLLPWLEPFCGRIREEAETGFYRALADCLLAFARRDREYLETLVTGCSEVAEPQPTEAPPVV